jgi:large subunit ribosomal protein L21
LALTGGARKHIIRRLYRLPDPGLLKFGAIMHAVIRTGGKQYRVAQGDVLRVEKLDAELGSTIELADVLLIADGDSVAVGTPVLEGKAVVAEVVDHARADKIEVIKFKRRKKYRRTQGHRQHYTQLKITSIPGA